MKKVTLAVMVAFLGLSLIGISSANACNNYWCPGTGTPGYWMNHPEAWPVSSITIGENTYAQEEAIDFMKAPVKGDKTLTMFAAYVAAYLNSEINCCPPPGCLGEAYAWLTVFPVGDEVAASSEAWQYSHGEAIYECLDDFNNGKYDAPSRDGLE